MIIQFKDIPENGSFAGMTINLPLHTGNGQVEIDALSLEEYTKCLEDYDDNKDSLS